MGKTKRDTQGFLVSAMVITIALIGFIGGFALSGELKERIFRANGDSKTKETESSDILIAGGNGVNKTYGFDEKYVESDSDNDYYIELGTYAGSNDMYFTVEFGDTKSELKITRYHYDSDESQEFTMEFTGNVVDVFLGSFNDDPQDNTLLFLLDNGDVCYSLIEDMVKENDYGSYSAIDELTSVIKFYSGKSCDSETAVCKSTTFAQTANGKILDLNSYIK